MERSLDEVLGLYVLEDSLNKINIQRAKCRNKKKKKWSSDYI